MSARAAALALSRMRAHVLAAHAHKLTPLELFRAAAFDVRQVAHHQRLGDAPSLADRAHAAYHDALNQASAAWNDSMQALTNAAFAPIDDIKAKLIASGQSLMAAGSTLAQQGAAGAGVALNELASRLAQAVVALGTGLGDAVGNAFQRALGASPFDIGLVGVGLLVLLGAGLFLTPGGALAIGQLGRIIPRIG